MLLVLIAGPVMAQVDILVGQVVVMRIYAPAGGMSAQTRADIIFTERIFPLLGTDEFYPEKMEVRVVSGDTCIFYNDKLIVVVDKEAARANRSTPKSLASVWVANLRDAIDKYKAMPYPGNVPTI